MMLNIKNILPAYFDESVKDRSEWWGKDFVIGKGDYVKIVAPSGSGKSSLVHFIYGLRNEYSGHIFYNEKDIRHFSAEDFAFYRRRHISIVFQDMKLLPELTVKKNLEIKLQLEPYYSSDKITEMAERLGIKNKLGSVTKICSYGEQQRASIIRALLQPYDLLILDEPFSHLDEKNAQLAMDLILEESRKREAAILFADLERIDYFPCTKLYHL